MRKATAFVAVMAWVVLAVAIAPLFVANGDSEVLAANFGGATVATEANKVVVNATPVQDTMKEATSKFEAVINQESADRSFVAFNGTQSTLEVVDGGGDIKINLDRGRNLSYIAWKYTGNGNAKNYCAIARASNLSCDESILRYLPVNTVITIPQSLLKSKFLPSPSAVDARGVVTEVNRLWHDEELAPLQNKYTDAQRELWLWRGVCALLVVTLLLVFWTAFGAIKQRERKYKNLETENENYRKLIPGSLTDFQTREGRVLKAMITRVELIEEHSCVIKPIVIEVECNKCRTRVNPKNFLSHYFKQHPAPIPGQFM